MPFCRLGGIVRRCYLWTLLLLPGGLAAGHLLGYAAVRAQGLEPSLETGHTYMHGLGALAAPLTLAALFRIGVSGARRERLPVGFVGLALQQVLAYVVVEVVEHAAAGIGPTASLHEPTMLWGIVAQLTVAAVVSLLARGVHGVTRRLVGRRATNLRPVRAPQWSVPTVVRSSAACEVALSSLSRRGPPLRLS